MIVRTRWLTLTIVAMILGTAVTAFAWHEKEHHVVTALSARLLSPQSTGMPGWFVSGIVTDAADDSLDPDNFKNRALPQLDDTEGPEHYLDYEPVESLNAAIPKTRYGYYKLCYDHKLDPSKLGVLPWALAEWQQRLTLAFAEYRRWPNNPTIQRKALVYAGVMAHYAGDLCQPLHTTMHHDGRVASYHDRSPRSGIHAKVDGLFRNISYDPAKVMAGAKAEVYSDLWASIWKEFHQSHALVDRVYELSDKLPSRDQHTDDPAVTAFATERMRASATFIASLYRTAWEKSAEVKLPSWLDREALTLPH